MGRSASRNRHGRRGWPRNAIAQQKIFPVERVAGAIRLLQPARAHRLRDSPSVKKETTKKIKTALSRPEPAKCPSGQQAIDEPIERFLEDHAPRLTFPYAVDQGPQAVSKECSGASDAKHGLIVRAGRNRVSRKIGNEETDEQAISEPQAEELRHGGRGAGING